MSRNDFFLLLACAAVAAMMAGNGNGSPSKSHLTLATVLPSLIHDDRPQERDPADSSVLRQSSIGDLQ